MVVFLSFALAVWWFAGVFRCCHRLPLFRFCLLHSCKMVALPFEGLTVVSCPFGGCWHRNKFMHACSMHHCASQECSARRPSRAPRMTTPLLSTPFSRTSKRTFRRFGLFSAQSEMIRQASSHLPCSRRRSTPRLSRHISRSWDWMFGTHLASSLAARCT